MAACGRIHPIFDNPLPESPTTTATTTTTTPWNQNHSLTDIFRDLYFQDDDNNNNNNNNNNNSPSTTSRSSAPPLPNSSKNPSSSSSSTSASSNRTRRTRRYSFSNIYDHDETTFTDLPAKPEEEEEEDEDRELRESNRRRLSRRYRRTKSFVGSFPPPISCLGRNGKPGTCFKYMRSDGRFILKEVRIANQDFLHVKREDGRLQLRLVHSESEDDDEDDDDHHHNKNEEVHVVAEETNETD